MYSPWNNTISGCRSGESSRGGDEVDFTRSNVRDLSRHASRTERDRYIDIFASRDLWFKMVYLKGTMTLRTPLYAGSYRNPLSEITANLCGRLHTPFCGFWSKKLEGGGGHREKIISVSVGGGCYCDPRPKDIILLSPK